MKFFPILMVSLLSFFVSVNAAVPFHDVLSSDSLNLTPANIRVNQVGYSPNDENKRAFIMAYEKYQPNDKDPFYIINAVTKAMVYEGEIEDSDIDFGRGNFHIKAYYNSITPWNPPYPLTSKNGDEHIYFASFGDFTLEGKFNIVCNGDTSHTFEVSKYLYNNLFNKELKFLAFQRCGEATWAHEACHVHDGEAVGHDLSGGWHDCGDHPKLSLTMSYTSMMIAMLAATLENKLTDQWNGPMNDSIFTDGLPDLLYEVHRICKYYMKLYNASKEDGIYPDEMYHIIGDSKDHNWWGKPEWQEGLPADQGGRPRPVKSSMGPEVGAKIGATLAYFSKVWQKYDPKFADECLAASKSLYEDYVLTHMTKNSGADHDAMYQSNGRFEDEIGAHVVALLWVTKDNKYKVDLLERSKEGESFGDAPGVQYNAELFYHGWFANKGAVQYHPGGWPQDWENFHAYTLYAFKKLILKDFTTAKLYGFTEEEYNELSIRTAHAFLKNLEAGGLIKDKANGLAGGKFIAKPYNLPDFNMAWGYNRYNLGMSIAGFLFTDAYGDQEFKVTQGLNITNEYQGKLDQKVNFGDWKWLENQAVRHIDYILGLNPWDISFVMGTGSKTLNHPHNRTSNAEMSNGSAPRYDYTVPIGALMGGQQPVGFVDDSGRVNGGLTLNEDAQNYIVDETCVDYSMVLMAMTAIKAEVLPPDTTAPIIFNHGWSQIDSQAVLVSWEDNELATDLLYYSKDPASLKEFVKTGTIGPNVKIGNPAKQPNSISDFQKKQVVTINDLVEDVTYYYVIVTVDVKGNSRTYDNTGDLFTFKLSDLNYEISGITICNLTSNSAEITWKTDQKAPSTVLYRIKGETDMDTVIYDDESPSTMFHKVTLKGLQSDTEYEYWVKSGPTVEGPREFKTEFEFAKLEINASMQPDGNFWFTVLNKENVKDYVGLEFRIFIPTNVSAVASYGGSLYWDIQPALYYYNGQVVKGPTIEKEFVTGSDYNYFSIKTGDDFTFQANGMLKFKLDISQLTGVSYNNLIKGWSFREHGKDESPYPYYRGIGPAEAEPNESNMIRQSPADWAGQLVLLPTNYIVAYHNDQHIYGYYPDYNFKQGTLKEKYDVTINVLDPKNTLFGNSTTIIGDEDTKEITIIGNVTIIGEITGNSKPVGNIQVNDKTASFEVNNDGNRVEFSCDYELKEGLNEIVIKAIDENDGTEGSCNSATQSLFITYKRGDVTQSDLKVVHLSGGEFPIDEEGRYKAIIGEDLIYLTVTDSDENVDDVISEKVLVTIASPTDTEQVYISEQGLSSGTFSNSGNILEGILIADIPSESYQTSDRIITAKKNDIITVKYYDDDYKDDITIKEIIVLEDFPSIAFVDSISQPAEQYILTDDVVSIEIRDKFTFEDTSNVVDEIVLTVTNSSGKDSEKFTLTRHPLKKSFYATSDENRMKMVLSSPDKMNKNDGFMSVQLEDTLYVSYEVKDEKLTDKIRVTINPEDYPIINFVDTASAPADYYVVATDEVSIVLKDRFSYDDASNNIDQIEVTVTNSSGKDSEKFTLSKDESQQSIYYTKKSDRQKMKMQSADQMKKNDGVMSVEFSDTLFVSYLLSGIEIKDIVIVGLDKQPWQYVEELRYDVAPNPLLISQLQDDKYRIRVAHPDLGAKFSIEFLENIGVLDLHANLYDINSNLVKRFTQLEISNKDSEEGELSISFDTKWDGNILGTSTPASTGGYILKFFIVYDKNGVETEKTTLVPIYLIKDVK